MRLNALAANAVASALASTRVGLLVAAALVLSQSVVLATMFFAAAAISFVATLLLATKLYRVRGPSPDAEGRPASGDAEALAPAASAGGAVKRSRRGHASRCRGARRERASGAAKGLTV